MTVARQRPATANGVVFMLLEDEFGMTNVVVLPPVYERHRLLVRTAGIVSITGKLERREGVINVVAKRLHELQRPDLPLADVRPIEPPVERETGRDGVEEPARRVAAGGARARRSGRRAPRCAQFRPARQMRPRNRGRCAEIASWSRFRASLQD